MRIVELVVPSRLGLEFRTLLAASWITNAGVSRLHLRAHDRQSDEQTHLRADVAGERWTRLSPVSRGTSDFVTQICPTKSWFPRPAGETEPTSAGVQSRWFHGSHADLT